jgi:trehalose utilization protein
MTLLPRVTVWNEGRHEKSSPKVKDVYPDGMHTVIAAALRERGLDAATATLDEPEHGLTAEVLENTDVLFWWGHMAHRDVSDEIVERVYQRVMKGMGLVVLHSGHFSKIFRKLMGTTCDLKWREIGEKERVWVVNPATRLRWPGQEYFELEHEEMYGEHFDIPSPDELVLSAGSRAAKSSAAAAATTAAPAKSSTSAPGTKRMRTYYQAEVQQVLYNAALWAAPAGGPVVTFGHRPEPIESIVEASS